MGLELIITVRYQLFFIFYLFQVTLIQQRDAVGYFMYFPEIMVCQDDAVVLGAFGNQLSYLFRYNGKSRPVHITG